MGCRALVIGVSSARHRGDGASRRWGGAWARLRTGGRGVLHGEEDEEDGTKSIDTFRGLRNARFSWICSGGLSTAISGRQAAAGEWRRDGVMELGSGWRMGPRAGFGSGGGGMRCWAASASDGSERESTGQARG